MCTSQDQDNAAGYSLMARLFHFCCHQGHMWDVESGKTADADRASSLCPICRGQGQSRVQAESADAADFEDELPPAPAWPVGAMTEGQRQRPWVRGRGRGSILRRSSADCRLRDPGRAGPGWHGSGLPCEASEPRPRGGTQDRPGRGACRVERALAASRRGRDRGPAEASQHRPDLRGRRAGQPSLPRARVRRGGQPGTGPRQETHWPRTRRRRWPRPWLGP